MNFSYKRLAVALGVVVALLVGGKMYVDHAEQVALEKEIQAFAAKVGRSPHPDGMLESVPDLNIAASLNLPVLTMSLLKGGADVHAKDKRRGRTPLHWAARNNASETAEVLLDHGADVQATNKYGDTPLHSAVRKDASETAEVLLDHGVDVQATDKYGDTPLHLAARNNASETAEVFLKRGADVNAKDNEGRTPLHYATEKNASATVEVLRRYGARK